MKKGQDTRGYQRYMALDIHREYILVGAWNEEKDWVLTPRRVSVEKFPEWAKKNEKETPAKTLISFMAVTRL